MHCTLQNALRDGILNGTLYNHNIKTSNIKNAILLWLATLTFNIDSNAFRCFVLVFEVCSFKDLL